MTDKLIPRIEAERKAATDMFARNVNLNGADVDALLALVKTLAAGVRGSECSNVKCHLVKDRTCGFIWVHDDGCERGIAIRAAEEAGCP